MFAQRQGKPPLCLGKSATKESFLHLMCEGLLLIRPRSSHALVPPTFLGLLLMVESCSCLETRPSLSTSCSHCFCLIWIGCLWGCYGANFITISPAFQSKATPAFLSTPYHCSLSWPLKRNLSSLARNSLSWWTRKVLEW